MIPYGHQQIDPLDIEAVVNVLKTDWLTQGPKVEEFESALATYCGVKYAVVVSNGTAALHAAYVAAGLNTGDEFITSPLTFVATANAGLWQGAKPVFVDVDERDGNINPSLIEEKITKKTKLIAPIDYTGRPVDFEAIRRIADKHNLLIVEDACQALGAIYRGKKIGSLSDLTVFSFHPVKTIATGEGGAILTDREDLYKKMKVFVTHGITKKDFVYPSHGEWYFEMQMLGMNYRLTDLQCALGISQLSRIDTFLARRRSIVAKYNEAFKGPDAISVPPPERDGEESAWHLYVMRLADRLVLKRAHIFKKLREAGIGVQVHHMPAYLHPYYQSLGFSRGLCPVAEAFYDSIISLPLYPGLEDSEQDYVISKVKEVLTSV
ncbi:MAG: Glutamine-scyllo-inositol transaminase [Candidatus Magasanikbacteria bacterium GW2011_GWA2_45_39]|uniref:Glutamine-scyllo-inositol transaminase n=2 Tax=Candidatus Magasanikiibacteriota TaxID=1752731 RepID=A0A0G1Q551_9BACT|nr:MAG: Glutamine-scyllo-inositol transaminase [Candidatus Magasanikbacteria bacterium GW2011_GWA2_45_39]KKU12853.1 MAG: Glutamine-scyllo-inositol transaminase [Candidatus Magasanikbacteria bacterium GW2011_GWC2_45_8]